MAQQVKFYSKISLPSENIDNNGVYFIRGGELYKGSQRFGLGRVTKAATAEALAALTGVARGDINVGFEGAKVYDGSEWQKLGGDAADIRAVVSSMTSGLAVGGNGSYITGITQDANGNVAASAAAFPTLATGTTDGTVKLGTGADAKVSGWDALVGSVSANTTSISGLSTKVSTLETQVSGIEGIVDVSNGGTVTASSGVFTNLTVSDTATFSVTNVSATTLTVNGSTIEQIADARIAAIASVTQSSTSNGVTVSVTTAGGSVTAVTVDASAFGNVMHFKGVVTALPSEAEQGDIVVIGANPTGSGLVAGQEYICTVASTTAPTWELIGDQNTYALNAYSSTAAVYSGATTLPAAVSAAGAAIDTLNTNIATKASVGTGASTVAGIGVEVSLASNAAPQVSMTVDASALSAVLNLGAAASMGVTTSLSGASDVLPTDAAVKTYVDTALSWITD